MKIIFAPSATHVDPVTKLFRVRFDIYPDEQSQTYPLQHIYAPIEPQPSYPGLVNARNNPIDRVAYNTWVSALPHEWRVNPILCAFVTIPELIDKAALLNYLATIFSPNGLATLDDILAKPSKLSCDLVAAWFKNKVPFSAATVKTKNLDDLIASTNLVLASIPELNITPGSIEPLAHGTTTIGSGATDRASSDAAGGFTCFDLTAQSTGADTLTAYEIWCQASTTNMRGGTFYWYTGSNGYKCRASATLGAITAGSKQTISGLSLTTTIDDWLGFYFTGAGALEATDAANSNAFVSGEYIDPGDAANYGLNGGCIESIYASSAAAPTFIPKIIIM